MATELRDVALSETRLLDLYRLMRLTRRLDRELMAMHRAGLFGTYTPAEGQEAAQVGSAFALDDGDLAFPSFRDLGVALARGADPVDYLVYYRGLWNGGRHDPLASGVAPIASAVGSHLPHAVGWAMGARLDGRAACAACYFGDGATSEGDAHEAMNLAGVFRAPVIFVCQNNGWAISVPVARQAGGPIWRRAEGCGIAGCRVDGNDVLAVYEATRLAAERARAGEGATLIEAMTYRVGPHSTSDDPGRYRAPGEAEAWRDRDPIAAYRARLEREGVAGAAFFEAVEHEVGERVAAIRQGIVTAPPPPPEEMFAFVYAELPAALEAQCREAAALARRD